MKSTESFINEASGEFYSVVCSVKSNLFQNTSAIQRKAIELDDALKKSTQHIAVEIEHLNKIFLH